MATLLNPPQRLKLDSAVASLTTVEHALLKLGMPILDADAVVRYKKRAKLGMLWSFLKWLVLGMAVLVGFECLGRQWNRAAVVGAAAVALATLFGWLVYASELRWRTMGYNLYRGLHPVPAHVSAAASALVSCGVSEEQIGVEYLKNDPILFVEDAERGFMKDAERGFMENAERGAGAKRYDLIIW